MYDVFGFRPLFSNVYNTGRRRSFSPSFVRNCLDYSRGDLYQALYFEIDIDYCSSTGDTYDTLLHSNDDS